MDSRLFLPDSVQQYRDRDKHFNTAISTLQLIKTNFTPEDKLGVILSMFRSITSSSSSLVWSMDTLLPVCMYVVVRARVLQLGAELAMLQDLMETHLFKVQFILIIIANLSTEQRRAMTGRVESSVFGSDLVSVAIFSTVQLQLQFS